MPGTWAISRVHLPVCFRYLLFWMNILDGLTLEVEVFFLYVGIVVLYCQACLQQIENHNKGEPPQKAGHVKTTRSNLSISARKCNNPLLMQHCQDDCWQNAPILTDLAWKLSNRPETSNNIPMVTTRCTKISKTKPRHPERLRRTKWQLCLPDTHGANWQIQQSKMQWCLFFR